MQIITLDLQEVAVHVINTAQVQPIIENRPILQFYAEFGTKTSIVDLSLTERTQLLNYTRSIP